MSVIKIKRQAVTQAGQGHPWIFSNQISDFPKTLSPGSLVDILGPRGEWMGRGYFNPHSLIAIRILTREKEDINTAFFEKRIKQALNYRTKLIPDETVYRLIFSEGDFLPGLIVDRYEDVLIAQFLTAGIQVLEKEIVEALKNLLSPSCILARNDAPIRALEKLPQENTVLFGERPEPMAIEKNGFKMRVDLWEGQKTGLYLDQSENQKKVAPLSKDARVLDAFSYSGGFGLQALKGGAKEILFLDSSEAAIRQAKENAELNGFSEKCRFLCEDAFDTLKRFDEEKRRFDMVILDPPSFTKSKTKIHEAARGYKEINLRAMKILEPGGFLISCSCSYHMEAGFFMEILTSAAQDARRTLRLIEFSGQSPDHPILPSVPETSYLKCAILQVI